LDGSVQALVKHLAGLGADVPVAQQLIESRSGERARSRVIEKCALAPPLALLCRFSRQTLLKVEPLIDRISFWSSVLNHIRNGSKA
jgi:hypothetical protein